MLGNNFDLGDSVGGVMMYSLHFRWHPNIQLLQKYLCHSYCTNRSQSYCVNMNRNMTGVVSDCIIQLTKVIDNKESIGLDLPDMETSNSLLVTTKW